VATAVAGARLGLDPFDQPDVEAAKVAARKLTAELEATGRLPDEAPYFAADGVRLFASDAEARALATAAGSGAGLEALLRAHLSRLSAGDYFALLAFAPISVETVAAAARLRRAVRRSSPAATTVGFGPRYLHSTGQAHKGGPPSGLFLVVGDTPARDLDVPGQRLSFGQAIAAQARGDFAVLAERGRRALRVELAEPAALGLPALASAVERALDG
jgi:transaldolase/glucose-6-phosphate isomerase